MRILIIGPSWVGDMAMAQTLFRCLKQRDPDLSLDVLAPDWTRPLLARMPEVARSIPMPVGHGRIAPGERRRLGKSLRAEGYRQAIVLPNSFKSALVPLFAKIPLRTGWRGEARSWLLNDCRVLDKSRYPLMIERFAALAFAPGEALPDPLPRPALHVDDEGLLAVRRKFNLDRERPVLALCPGAEFGPSKKWPESGYARLAGAAIRAGRQVWLMGSSNDAAAAAAIGDALASSERRFCHDFTGRTTLGEAIDLMSLADAVVSNDSGLMHIAAALDRPLVVIYGSTSPSFTPPLAERVSIVSVDLPCRPCYQRECPLGHLNCLRQIEPERVGRALQEVERE